MNGTLVVIIQLVFSYFLPHSSMKLCNQIISLLSFVAATYSASIVESATTFCSFEIKLTLVQSTIKTYPVVLILLSLSPAISTSTYPCRTMFELQNIMHEKRYLSNTRESIVLLFNALYLDCYMFTTLTAFAIFGLVHTMAYSKLPTADE